MSHVYYVSGDSARNSDWLDIVFPSEEESRQLWHGEVPPAKPSASIRVSLRETTTARQPRYGTARLRQLDS